MLQHLHAVVRMTSGSRGYLGADSAAAAGASAAGAGAGALASHSELALTGPHPISAL